MGATDDNDEMACISEPGIGRYAAVLLPALIAMTGLLATGLYYPGREDRLWALISRKALPEQAEPLNDSTTISLTRTMCEGRCPEYTVRIFGSGRIEYVGIAYVCTYGAQAAQADPREVRRLVEAMIGTGFFDFAWPEGLLWLDAPTVTSVLQHGERSYALRHDHGDQGAPRWLLAMEDEIDRVAGTARWLPRAGEETNWRALCATPEGGVRDVTLSEPSGLDPGMRPVIVPPAQVDVAPLRYEVRL